MELLSDVGLVESRFGPLEKVLVLGKIVARCAPNIPWAQKSFWTHLMVLLGDEA
jgi:hypothetical protein